MKTYHSNNDREDDEYDDYNTPNTSRVEETTFTTPRPRSSSEDLKQNKIDILE